MALVSTNFHFRTFDSWLDAALKENEALSASVGSSVSHVRLRWYERWVVARGAAPGTRALGIPKDENE
jgi:N-acyl-D-aspartate/D-glutamate deacylase